MAIVELAMLRGRGCATGLKVKGVMKLKCYWGGKCPLVFYSTEFISLGQWISRNSIVNMTDKGTKTSFSLSTSRCLLWKIIKIKDEITFCELSFNHFLNYIFFHSYLITVFLSECCRQVNSPRPWVMEGPKYAKIICCGVLWKSSCPWIEYYCPWPCL